MDIQNREEAVAILSREDSINFSLLLARPDVEVRSHDNILFFHAIRRRSGAASKKADFKIKTGHMTNVNFLEHQGLTPEVRTHTHTHIAVTAAPSVSPRLLTE